MTTVYRTPSLHICPTPVPSLQQNPKLSSQDSLRLADSLVCCILVRVAGRTANKAVACWVPDKHAIGPHRSSLPGALSASGKQSETDMAKRGPKNPLTPEHKAAMSIGRNEARAVRMYLETLRIHRPRRGPQVSAEELRSRLDSIEIELPAADPITELKLLQKRRDITKELKAMSSGGDLKELEEQFVAVVASYAIRNQIDYETWREAGVQTTTLDRAGLQRKT